MMKQTLILLKLIRKPHVTLTQVIKEKIMQGIFRKQILIGIEMQNKDKNNSAPYDIFSKVFNSLCL